MPFRVARKEVRAPIDPAPAPESLARRYLEAVEEEGRDRPQRLPWWRI